MDMTVDSLQIEVQATSTAAVKSIDDLSNSLSKLGKAVGGLGLNAVAKQFKAVGTALNALDSASISNLGALADGLEKLSTAGKVKISASIPNQITNLGTAIKSLNGADFTQLTDLANAISPLATVGKANLGSTINQLQKLPAAIQPLTTMDMGGVNTKIQELVNALKPLSEMAKANLSSSLNQIKKLPEAFNTLNAMDLTAFEKKIREVAAAMSPLATEMQKVANGFSAFPAKIQKLLNATNQIPYANSRAGKSYLELAAKIAVVYTAVRRAVSLIGSWINESNDYIESVNLFNVSLGSYASEAYEYAQTVGEVMGIDPAEWMENQGVFMNLATGFGVVSDRAYTMSKNLTQLGYDLSSFFNLSYAEAMQKLQSGMAGETEALRRLGYDLSQTRLEAVALSLGIDKAVASMTQAEKAELRYYAIMTMATNAQGDMARTLNAPANQLRVLKAQVTQAARALGNIFIPALNAVLPFAIAVAKVVQYVASAIASLFGFEIPAVDYSGLTEVSGGAADASDALDDATGSAKALKKTLLGIDELNLLTDNSNSGGGADIGGGGGGFDFELPTYDFIDELTESRVAQIVKDMKEWLGLTEEINSWADLLDTRFGTILKTVGLIGAGIVLWKVSKGFIDSITTLKTLLATPSYAIAISATIAIVGLTIAFDGMEDAVENGLDGFNFGEILGGSFLTTGASALLGSKLATWISTTFAGSAVDLAITQAGINLGVGTVGAAGAALAAGAAGIILGIPTMFVGIYDAVVSGLDWLNGLLIPIGTTLLGAGAGTVVGAIIGSSVAPGVGTIVGLIAGALTDVVILVAQNWDEICDFFAPAWNWFYTTVLKPVFDFLSTAASWFYNNVVTPIINFFAPILDAAIYMVVLIYNKVKEIVSGIITAIGSVFSKVSEIFLKIVEMAVALGKAAYTYIIDPLVKTIGKAATAIYNAVIKPVIDFFISLGKKAYEYIVKPIYDKVVWLKDKAVELFKSIGTTVVTFVSNAFKSVINGVLSAIERTINGFIRMLNGAIGIINAIPGVSISKVTLLSIPRLAEGGMVNTGQMFVAREAGPELVGTIGNRTAVVNNDQIVESVSQGVYEANSEQNALLREQNSLLRKLLEKDTSVTAVIGTGSVIGGLERKNRRDGKTIVPVGY